MPSLHRVVQRSTADRKVVTVLVIDEYILCGVAKCVYNWELILIVAAPFLQHNQTEMVSRFSKFSEDRGTVPENKYY